MKYHQLRAFIKECVAKHPHLKEEIYDLYELCLDEIEEGGSVDHEIQLCITSIEQLIEEDGKDQ